MGLDSVELLMEWEDFFVIRIPDLEASQIGTIGEAVDYISNHIQWTERDRDIKSEVAKDLMKAFESLGYHIPTSQNIFKVLPIVEREAWKKISEQTKFSLPLEVGSTKLINFFDKLFSSKARQIDSTFDRFCDLTCAVNYQDLIPQGKVKNKYEVMIAVMGMTIEKSGVSPFDVYWESSFYNDLGID